MDKHITDIMGKTLSNIAKTGAVLLISTIASNELRKSTNETIQSVTQSYQGIKQSILERKNQ